MLACGAINGKPGTSAPGGGFDSESEFWDACYERRSTIEEWEQGELEKLEGKWADGKITFLRAAIDSEKIEEEADAMDDELMDNCKTKADREFPYRRSPRFTSGDDPLPTPTRRR